VKDILASELNQTNILAIFPDTLFFRFSERKVKKVPVIPVLDMHGKFFEAQYMLNGDVQVIPDSIIISGAASIIDKYDGVFTDPVSLNGVNDTINMDIRLNIIDQVAYSQQRVKLIIPTDRFTEAEMNLSVSTFNVPDSLQLRPIPGQVRVNFRVCLSNYGRAQKNPPGLYIDFMDISTGLNRLPVMLLDTPSYISNIKISPAELEYLITIK